MKKSQKIIAFTTMIILIAIALSTIIPMNSVKAADQKGSVTLNKVERKAEDGTENKPLNGVNFKIYKVDDNETNTSTPAESVTPLQTSVTGENGTDGQVVFGELDEGRYLIVEDSAPENVAQNGKVANFLIDIPYTELNNENNWNPVVNPKNNTVYGTIDLTKYSKDVDGNREPLEGVTFLLQKQVNGEWVDYVKEGTSEAVKAVTDEEGKITITGLPEGTFRFIEIDVGEANKGYILDSETGYEFTVSLDTNEMKTVVNPPSLEVDNQKPELEKTIEFIRTEESRNTYTDKVIEEDEDFYRSGNVGDKVGYAVKIYVPYLTIDRLNTYKVSDHMIKGLTNDKDYVVKGHKLADDSEEKLSENVEYKLVKSEDDNWEMEFDTELLKEYKDLVIEYITTISKDADTTRTGNKNIAKLVYSTSVLSDYKGDPVEEIVLEEDEEILVSTGGFKITKVAAENRNEKLAGAKFKLAISEANAKKGLFVKDKDGKDIEIVTDKDGIGSCQGLAYGDYYLVETEAPKYKTQENGKEVEKSFEILKKYEKITVTAETSDVSVATIVNRRSTVLPITGGTIVASVLVLTGIILTISGAVINKRNNKMENDNNEIENK